DRLPVDVADGAVLPHRAGAAPGAVVLQAAIDVVGHVHVHRDVVVLAERQVGGELPGVAAVVADAHAAVLAGDEVAPIVRIDPHGVIVAVDVAGVAQGVERLGAVVGDPQAGGQAVDPVRPLRIDADVGVVERPLAGRLVGVGGLPGAAAVLGAQHHVVAFRLHQGVDDARLGGRDGEADAAEGALRQAGGLGPPLPAVPAAGGE